MISPYRDYNGKIIQRTRVSNSTFIDHPQNLNLAQNVYIGHHNFIEASQGITIEEGCQITSFISITSHSSHQSIRLYGNHYFGAEMIGYLKGSVHIGKFTFVGPHSTIMPNTKIGKGSIVAAYSYVQGEFPDFAIIAGNPAKMIGNTREKDNEFLDKHPELKAYYDEWATT
jgi:acetyltransferase-like isoleucine patch superfamily enzyme